MRTTLTIQDLIAHNACYEQRADFLAEWPDGSVNVTVDGALAVASRFAWDWAACNFLSAAARAQYDNIMAGVATRYEAAIVPAREHYIAVSDNTPEASYYASTGPARAQYRTAVRDAQKQYNDAAAVAFAESVLAHGIR